MKAILTVGSTNYTLADYTASPRLSGTIEHWPYTGIVDVIPLYGAANPAIFPRGNAGGQLVFSVFGSYGGYDNWTSAVKAAQALAGQQGTLVITPNVASSTVTYTMVNATLKTVQPTDLGGIGGRIRYTFEVASIA